MNNCFEAGKRRTSNVQHTTLNPLCAVADLEVEDSTWSLGRFLIPAAVVN
jgi:hypothetical protein